MSWETSSKGWQRWVSWDDDGNRIGHIVLRPYVGKKRPARGKTVPDSAPVYFLASLLVRPNFRGQGVSQDLLRMGAQRLVDLHGEAWFGLMTDNFRFPAGKTHPDVRRVWEAFLAKYSDATMQEGYILLNSSLDQ